MSFFACFALKNQFLLQISGFHFKNNARSKKLLRISMNWYLVPWSSSPTLDSGGGNLAGGGFDDGLILIKQCLQSDKVIKKGEIFYTK